MKQVIEFLTFLTKSQKRFTRTPIHVIVTAEEGNLAEPIKIELKLLHLANPPPSTHIT